MSFLDGVPWAIAVIGWGSTHLFSEARERRKEIRAQLDKAYEQLQKLEQDAQAFHCGAAFDLVKSIELTTRLLNLKRSLRRITLIDMRRLDRHIIALRRAISLDNFSKSTFSQQDAGSPILFLISAAAQDLEDSLESQYSVRYPNRFPYFVLGRQRMPH